MASKTNISDFRFSIFINNDQAKKALIDLEKTVNLAENALQDLEKQGKGNTDEANKLRESIKTNRSEMEKFRKEAGLNALSLKELIALRSHLQAEYARSIPGSDEWVRLGKEINVVSNRTEELRVKATQTGISWKSMLNIAGGMGLYGIAERGLQLLFNGIDKIKGIMNSADSSADKFNRTITGLTWGWDMFKKALATGDFSNLIRNMETAIRMGREYADTLDLIEDRTRAMSVTESEQKTRFEELKVMERDVTLSKKERVNAGKEALAIEENMLRTRMSIAKQDYDNEMMAAKTRTGLGEATIRAYFKNFEQNINLIQQAQEYLDLQDKISNLSRMDLRNSGGAAAIDQTKLVLLADLQSKLSKVSSEAKAYSVVVKGIGRLDMSDENNEVMKLVNSWVKLGGTLQESIRDTARIKIGLGKLSKGILDDNEQETQRSYKSLEKSAEEHEKYIEKLRKDTESSLIQFIQDAKEKEIAIAKLEWKRRIEEIKGESEDEKILRGMYQDLMQQDIDRINKAWDDKRIENEWKLEKEIWDIKLSAIQKNDMTWLGLQTEFLDKQRDHELNNTELTEQERLLILEKYAKLREKLITDFQANRNSEKPKEEKKASGGMLAESGAGDIQPIKVSKRIELLKKQRDEELKIAEGSAADQKAVWENYYAALVQVVSAFVNTVAGYAQTTLNALSGVNSAMSEYENASLAREVNNNDKKKESYKRQLNEKKITQKQYDTYILKLDAEMEQKKRELQVKQAKRQKALSLAQAIINTAQAVTSALSAGPIIGIILAALVGILGAIQIGYIASQPIPEAAKGRYRAFLKAKQAAMGRYDVLGQDDHKQYRGVPFIPSPDSGVYGRPTLFAETGREIILNPVHTENLMRFRPDLVQAIMQVPQRASGYYPSQDPGQQNGAPPVTVKFDDETLMEMRMFREQLRRPVRASVLYDDMIDSMDSVAVIENRAAR